MTLSYSPPPQSSTTKHHHIYSTPFGVYAFFLLLGIVSLAWSMTNPTFPADSHRAFYLTIAMNACFLGAIIIVLIIRLAFPTSRRWPTLGLNLILLLSIPFGTALAIYGLLKADLALRQKSPDNAAH